MSFRDFLGNEPTVRHLRESIATARLPHSLILAGPRGAGKYTLAVMLAQAANCLDPRETDGLPDFCGVCSNCTRIGQSADLDARVAEAIAARDDLRETDKKETRILIQPHPDVLIVPPDPPQNLIKIGQVRQVIHNAYYRQPVEGKRSIFLFTSFIIFVSRARTFLRRRLVQTPVTYWVAETDRKSVV